MEKSKEYFELKIDREYYEKLKTIDYSKVEIALYEKLKDYRIWLIENTVENYDKEDKSLLETGNYCYKDIDLIMIVVAYILIILQEPTLSKKFSLFSIEKDVSILPNKVSKIIEEYVFEDEFKYYISPLINIFSKDELLSFILFNFDFKHYLDTELLYCKNEELLPDSLLKLSFKILDIKNNDEILVLSSDLNNFLIDNLLNKVNMRVFCDNKSIATDFMCKLKASFFTEDKKIILNNNLDIFKYLEDTMEQKVEKIFLNLSLILEHYKKNKEEITINYRDKIKNKYAISNEILKNTSIEWLSHTLLINQLKENGRAISLVEDTILSNPENKDIRKYFIENGYIETIILLPTNMTFGFSTPLVLIVFGKGNEKVKFVDASKLYENKEVKFINNEQENIARISDENIDKILDLINSDAIPQITLSKNKEEFLENGYDLSVIENLKNLNKLKNLVVFKDVIKNIMKGSQIKADKLMDEKAKRETPYIYLSLSDINDGLIDFENIETYLKRIPENQEKFLIKNNFILLSKYENPPYKFVVAQIPDDKKVIPSGNFFIIEVDEKKLNPWYLMAFFSSSDGYNELKKAYAKSNAKSNESPYILSIKRLEEIMISVPAMEEQNKIGQEYFKIISEIKEMKKSLNNKIKNSREIFDKFGMNEIKNSREIFDKFDMNVIKRILNFWKEINLLMPITVRSIAFRNQISLSTREILKVPYDRIEDSLLLNNDEKYEIEIGFGDIKNTYLYEKGNIEKKDFIDGDGGESFIFAFKIDGDKKYKENSFNISKFAFILLKNIASKNFDEIEYEIKRFNENIEINLKSCEYYNVENIKRMTSLILRELNIDNLDEKILKKYFYLKLFNSNNKENSNESSFYEMDFYIKDLDKIAKADLKDESLLSNIIYPKESKNRQKIDDNTEFLEKITFPKNMPLGKWPSKDNPNLMEATAINIYTSKDYSPNIFSVNAAPGTGKMILLKEIIADTIVKKAKVIADLNSTDLENIETNTTISYYCNYYKIPNELKKLGIIVSSNNNSVVENISKDLPKAEDVLSKDTLTDLFDINEQKNIYFTKDSENIFGDNPRTWGLISAPYGRKVNIQKILNILPEKTQKNEDFNFSFAKNIPDFKEALNKFQKKYNEVLEYRENFNDDIEKFLKNKEEKLKINDGLIQISKLRNEIENLIEKHKVIQDNKEHKASILELKEKEKSNIENSHSFIQKLTRKVVNIFAGEKNSKILELNKDIETLSEELKNIDEVLGNIENDRDEYDKKIEFLENRREDLKKIEEKINMFFKSYSSNEKDLKLLESCSDLENFYKDIIKNAESQKSFPWGVEEFNKLREELFACSLSLIEAYIVNSKGIKANLKLLKLLLSGENLGYSVEERKNVFKECFHTLNLLIPVLSITFASVSRAFKDFEENELGIVIIDEAGQATPFSAMGLLYRANRCIVVGDPFQVKPVVTVTSSFIRTIANKYGLNELKKEFNIAGKIYDYKSPDLSIQTLADYANLYYGKIGETEVGCPLVVRRDPLSSIFDFSNKFFYDNKIINESISENDKAGCVLEKDGFLDVKGQEIGNGNHYVKEQGEKVIEIIKDCILHRGINVFESSKNLYVISPFPSVIDGLKNDIKKAFKDKNIEVKNWCENCLGTVHKFQGKEANSVILLLGCDNNSKSSAQWAAQEDNIFNVAATRAKKRFAIIGDLELWGKLNFFKDLKEVFDEFNKK